jgi:hypothetical protein
MATAERGTGSWLAATLDLLLAVLGFTIVWYPIVSLGNAALGSPVSTGTVQLVVSVLALGGAYPVVAGDWSLGQLGEFVFALTASAFVWGVIGLLTLLLGEFSFDGSNRLPQVVVWLAAYLTAYVLVFRTSVTLLE